MRPGTYVSVLDNPSFVKITWAKVRIEMKDRNFIVKTKGSKHLVHASVFLCYLNVLRALIDSKSSDHIWDR